MMTVPGAPDPYPRVTGFLSRLARLQSQRPWVPITVIGIITALAATRAAKLQLKTQFDQLLPQNQPSVTELHRVINKTSTGASISVVLEGKDTARLRAFADDLVNPLRAVGRPWVSAADSGVQRSRDFLMPRAGLFMEEQKLVELRDELRDAWGEAVVGILGFDSGQAKATPTVADIKKRFGGGREESAGDMVAKFPDGYYQSEDGHAVVVLVRTALVTGDLDGSREALNRVKTVVGQVQSEKGYGDVHAGYAGDLVTSLAEYGAVKADLLEVGVVGVSLVLMIIMLFFMRVRALAALGASIVVGLLWTFGFTQMVIGHLNVATGFLVSIVAGNGINAGIIYMARYFEERKRGTPLAESIAIAHQQTWLPTLGAVVAAGAAYGSLGVTEFLGFKHFAVIGGSGMVLCWIVTYTLTPAVLVLAERVKPLNHTENGLRANLGSLRDRFSDPFVWLASRNSRPILVASTLLTLVGVVLTVLYVRSDPMEYDLHQVRTEFKKNDEAHRLSALASNILGANLEGSMVVLADSVDEVPPLKAALNAKRDAAPKGKKPFEEAHTLFDFVAPDQAKKIPILQEIAKLLRRAHSGGGISREDWKQVAPLLPPADLKPYGFDELPREITEPFTERDGTRGRIVYIEPTHGESDSDLHYLLRWTDAFRETKLPDGKTVRGSGRAVIFADMLSALVHDIPRAVVLSGLFTLLAVLITFRRGALSLLVVGSVLVGVSWLVAILFATHERINFINFVALPITFGIGADYSLNVIQRYASGEGVVSAIRHTGAAVVLCSMTTILSYLALLGSINHAVRSLGLVAVLGEVCCLSVAVISLPALLHLFENRRQRQTGQAAAA